MLAGRALRSQGARGGSRTVLFSSGDKVGAVGASLGAGGCEQPPQAEREPGHSVGERMTELLSKLPVRLI